MRRYSRERSIHFAINDDLWVCAECRLAEVAHPGAAHANHVLGRTGEVDDPVVILQVAALLEGTRDRDVLLRDEAHGDAVADGLVEEGANLLRSQVAGTFLEATS